MKRAAIRTIQGMLDAAWSRRASQSGRMIYYHSVHPSTSRSHRPAQFRAQLQWLREQGWRSILARDIPPLTDSGDLAGCVSITFDDGYRDNLEYALPILEEEGFQATFFVVASLVDDSPRSSDEGGMLYDGRPMLTESDLRAMHQAGMEVASHGWSHRQATELLHTEGFSALVEELRRSRELLGEVIGEEVVSYAYPNGQLGARSASTARAAQLAGYSVCASTLWGSVAGGHPLELNRCEMSCDDSLDEFAAKMRGGRDWRNLANRVIDRSGVWYQ